MKAKIWLWLLFPVMALKADELKKTAVLLLPDQIECKSGGGASLNGEIELRWDENEPLRVELWWNSKTGKNDKVGGSIRVYDEKGRELEKVIYVTMPLTPSGETLVNKGEVKRFGIYEMYSTVGFPRPGDYYAIATIDSAWFRKTNIVLTSGKRWFKIVETLPKKNGL